MAIEAACAGVHFEILQTVDPTPGAVDGQFCEMAVTSTLQAALSAPGFDLTSFDTFKVW